MKDLVARGGGGGVSKGSATEGNKTSFGVPRTHHKQRRQKVAVGQRRWQRRWKRKRRRTVGRGSRAISPGSQSKNPEHIFSSLESSPGCSIGRRVESPSVRPDVSSFSILFRLFLSLSLYLPLAFSFFLCLPLSTVLLSISSTCSPRSPEIKARRHQQLGPWGVIRDEGWEPAVVERVKRGWQIGQKGGHTIFINAPW